MSEPVGSANFCLSFPILPMIPFRTQKYLADRNPALPEFLTFYTNEREGPEAMEDAQDRKGNSTGVAFCKKTLYLLFCNSCGRFLQDELNVPGELFAISSFRGMRESNSKKRAFCSALFSR